MASMMEHVTVTAPDISCAHCVATVKEAVGAMLATLIVWVAVLILYQQVENNLVQPFVYGKAVELHPLIVIIAILIGAALLGVLGALVAIPAAAAVQAVVRDYWRFRQARRGEGPPAASPEAGPPAGPAEPAEST